jgi:putative spermidine/putrescine transport system permease protein
MSASQTNAIHGGRQKRKPPELMRVLSYGIMVGIVISILFPLVPIVLWSFSFRWTFPNLFPDELSLQAWQAVFSPTNNVIEAVVTGGTIALAATGLSLLIAIPSGRALGLHKFRGKKLVEFLILAPVIVPSMASVMGIHIAFIKFGLAGTILGVTLAHLIPTTPYVVTVMSSVFANYDPEYEEQARTLGAGPIRTFMHVTLPAILPGAMVAGFFAFIISWGQYIVTLLISGGKIITVPLLLVTFANERLYPITAALCLVFLAPSVVLLLLTSRSLTGKSSALGGFAP